MSTSGESNVKKRMRVRPRVGTKLWFGPRRLGYGWTPVSWEGWLVSILGVVGILAPFALSTGQRRGSGYMAWTLFVVAMLLFACVLKGSSPGGSEAHRRFMRERDARGSSDR